MTQELKNLTDENFQTEVDSGLTLVDFYTESCGPCRKLAPILEKIASEMKDTAAFAKLDISVAYKTASSLGVSAFPTMILFKDGLEVGRLVGLRDENTIREFVLDGWFEN